MPANTPTDRKRTDPKTEIATCGLFGGLFNTLGRSTTYLGSSLISGELAPSPIQTVSTSATRGALGAMALSAIALSYKYTTSGSASFDDGTPFLLTLAAGATSAALTFNFDEILPELAASVTGFCEAMLLIFLICKLCCDSKKQEQQTENMANTTP